MYFNFTASWSICYLISAYEGKCGMGTITGTNKDNFLRTASRADTINALGGNDWIVANEGSHRVNGGEGSDTLSFAEVTTERVIVSLARSSAQDTGAARLTISGFENLFGSVFNDVLVGDKRDNRLNGSVGNDTLSGADGNDYLIGGLGNDTYRGGNGRDIASFQFASVGITVDLGKSGRQDTGEGSDSFDGIENLFGSARSDVIIGNNGSNTLNGGSGNDYIAGYSAAGSKGLDTLIGGRGADTFGVQAKPATRGAFVLDFEDGVDKIDISRLANIELSDLVFVRRDGDTFINLNDSPGTLNDTNLLVLNGFFSISASDFIL
jgi:Ca2+-binding RTX toxin-like protein